MLKKCLKTAFILSSLIGGSAFAATNTYQVTGPILEMNDASVTVQKGKEKWEIARDSSTKISGELAVGKKVTVEYRMTATNVEVKEAKEAKGKKK